MTIVDTRVWIAHFRHPDPLLADLITRDEVLVHPFVLGELAAGNLPTRARTLAELGQREAALVAANHDVLRLVETHCLWGLGLRWVDLHLLASALTSRSTLLTHNERLADAARKVGVAFPVQ